MNPVIDNNDRRLPYELSEERFEALHDRIRGQIARRAAATGTVGCPAAGRNRTEGPVRRSLLRVSLGFAVAAVVAAGIVTAHRLRQPVAAEPGIEDFSRRPRPRHCSRPPRRITTTSSTTSNSKPSDTMKRLFHSDLCPWPGARCRGCTR